MKRYEYKNLDLSPTFSWNSKKKHDELVDRLNELGKDGWMLVVLGIVSSKYSIVMREIPEDDGKCK